MGGVRRSGCIIGPNDRFGYFPNIKSMWIVYFVPLYIYLKRLIVSRAYAANIVVIESILSLLFCMSISCWFWQLILLWSIFHTLGDLLSDGLLLSNVGLVVHYRKLLQIHHFLIILHHVGMWNMHLTKMFGFEIEMFWFPFYFSYVSAFFIYRFNCVFLRLAKKKITPAWEINWSVIYQIVFQSLSFIYSG